METIVITRQLDCASAPKALWALIADTERLNRAQGQAPLLREPHSSDSAARYLLRTDRPTRALPATSAVGEKLSTSLVRRLPQPFAPPRFISFEEQPAQWVYPSRLSVKRTLHGGAIASIETSFVLTPQGTGTRVALEMRIVPRFPLLAPLCRLHGRWALWSLSRTIAVLDVNLMRGHNLLRWASPLHAEALAKAQAQVAAQLSPEQAPLLERLISHLRVTDDLEVCNLRPFALAESWGVDREALLAICLHGAAHGLLALSWDVICPSCRQPASRHATLSELGEESHCQMCDLHIATSLERNVEVSFRPAAAIKPTPPHVYSGGSPSQVPHVLTQIILPPASKLQLTAPTEPGEYLLFVRGGLSGQLSVGTLSEAHAQLHIGEQITPPRVEVAMGGTIDIVHEAVRARHLKLERLEWTYEGALAHPVTLQPLFRRYFPGEVLGHGLTRGVQHVGLWQSELLGGTELCAQLGDVESFRLQQAHFEVLRTVVAQEQGSLVRTEREGVLAAFRDTESAVRAALSAQQAFAAFRSAHAQAAPLSLRIGLYAGPAQLSTLGGVLDYHGQTVNLCRRMLREAHPGDIVLHADLGEKQSYVQGLKIGPRFTIAVRGLPSPLPVVRLNFDPPSPGEVSTSFRV